MSRISSPNRSPTGEFGAYHVGGDTYLADHRIANPSASKFATDIWREIDAARKRGGTGKGP
jgi:hypothetical protein